MHKVEVSVTATTAKVAVAGRVAVVVGCTALIPIGAAPGTSAAVVVAVLVWQTTFVVAFLDGRRPQLTAVADSVVLAAACVLLPWLHPPHGYLGLDDWALPVTSVIVGAAQFYTRPLSGAVVTVVTAAAVVTGSMLAADDDWNLDIAQAVTLLWQGGLGRCLIVLVAGSARRVDELAIAEAASRRTARLAAARRADVDEHLALLHDTVAATLTAAAARGVAGPELRRSARSDLSRLEPVPGPATVAELGTPPDFGMLRITTVAPDGGGGDPSIPQHAIDALAAARDEALRNVERHAGTDCVRLELLLPAPGSVELNVVDDGRGFRPDAVDDGAHFGLRLSIEARMRRAGGSARVVSAPGRGTRVELRWPTPAPREPG